MITHKIYKKSVVTLAIVMAGSTTTSTSYAQESATTLEEIVVTAQYRAQSLQDVPIAMSAFGGEDLDRSGVATLEDISRLAPDFVAINDLGAIRLSVRGIESGNGQNETSDQALTFNIDGEYINRVNFINSAMFDLERVEVLRGPQGTLYGRNATAGAVNAHAVRPSLEGVEGSISADFGNYSAQTLNAAINVPLGDTFAVRVAGMSTERDGYTEYNNLDQDLNDDDLQAARIGLLFEPNEDLSFYLAFETAEQEFFASQVSLNANDGAFPNTSTSCTDGWVSLPAAPALPAGQLACAPLNTNYLDGLVPRENSTFLAVAPGPTTRDTDAIRGEIKYSLDSAQVSYRFGYRDGEQTTINAVPGLNFFRFEEMEMHSHEIRVTGGNDSGLFWQTGLFYFKEELNNGGGLHAPFGPTTDAFGGWLNTSYRPDLVSESKAIFGQIEFPLSDELTLVAGARYTDDEKTGSIHTYSAPPGPPFVHFSPGGFDQMLPLLSEQEAAANNFYNIDFNSFDNQETTWTLGLNYAPDDSTLHFAKISKGYKAGGFDAINSFAPETVTAFEVGSRNSLGDSSILNLNAFYYDYTDLQTAVLLDTALGGQIFNAGEATIWGIEATYETSLTDNGVLTLTANYLNAEYDEFNPLEVNVQCVNGCGLNSVTFDASGNRMPNTPEFLLTASYEHTWSLQDGEVVASIFARFKDDYQNSPHNMTDAIQEAYTQTDVNLGYFNNRGWNVSLYVRNLEDERPISYFGFTSAGPNNDDFNWSLGAPRTFGVKVGYDF